MADNNIDEWNELLVALTDEEHEWLLGSEDPVTFDLLELDDWVNSELNGDPDEWAISQLRRLLSSMRRKIEDASRGS